MTRVMAMNEIRNIRSITMAISCHSFTWPPIDITSSRMLNCSDWVISLISLVTFNDINELCVASWRSIVDMLKTADLFLLWSSEYLLIFYFFFIKKIKLVESIGGKSCWIRYDINLYLQSDIGSFPHSGRLDFVFWLAQQETFPKAEEYFVHPCRDLPFFGGPEMHVKNEDCHHQR